VRVSVVRRSDVGLSGLILLIRHPFIVVPEQCGGGGSALGDGLYESQHSDVDHSDWSDGNSQHRA
jgi:hypothetical protein